MAWDDFVTSVGAQATAVTAVAVAVGWWGRRVVRWWRKMKVWRDAQAQERFAERAAQHLDAVIAPRFDELHRRVVSIEDKFQLHLDEAVDRRRREDAASDERQVLFQALREHMAKEDARDRDGDDTR
jgi:hypothetical protein